MHLLVCLLSFQIAAFNLFLACFGKTLHLNSSFKAMNPLTSLRLPIPQLVATYVVLLMNLSINILLVDHLADASNRKNDRISSLSNLVVGVM